MNKRNGQKNVSTSQIKVLQNGIQKKTTIDKNCTYLTSPSPKIGKRPPNPSSSEMPLGFDCLREDYPHEQDCLEWIKADYTCETLWLRHASHDEQSSGIRTQWHRGTFAVTYDYGFIKLETIFSHCIINSPETKLGSSPVRTSVILITGDPVRPPSDTRLHCLRKLPYLSC